MLFKVATLNKSLATDVTYISFLTSMNSAVELEMFFGTQRLATDITDINICPSVGVHVQHQRFLISICLATEFTLVQFLVICVCMGFHVVRKRTLVCISFTTHFTFTQFFLKLWSGVNAPLVCPKAMFVSESDATLVASEGFLPCMRDLV